MDRSLKTKRQKGFTIVEILIVIVVIAIIAAITVLSYTKITGDARRNAFISTLNSYSDAANMHRVASGALSSGTYMCLGGPENYPAHDRFTQGACMLMGDTLEPIDPGMDDTMKNAVRGPVKLDVTEESIIPVGGPSFTVVGLRGLAFVSLSIDWAEHMSLTTAKDVILYPSKPYGCIGSDIFAQDLPPAHPYKPYGYLVNFGDSVCVRHVGRSAEG